MQVSRTMSLVALQNCSISAMLKTMKKSTRTARGPAAAGARTFYLQVSPRGTITLPKECREDVRLVAIERREDGVIELLIVQAPYPEKPDTTPREELWTFAHAFRDVLRAHPRVLPLVATSPLRTPATLAILDRLLETIQRTQINGVQAIYALQCLVGFIVGHTLLGMGTLPVAGLEPGPNGPSVWQQFPAEYHPTLHAMLPEIAHWNADHEFDFGLQALFQSLFE